MEFLTGNIVFWNLLTFGVLVIILGKYGWKPIMKALDSRREKLKAELDHAEAKHQEAERLLANQKTIISEARNEADQIVAKARLEAEHLRDAYLKEAHHVGDGIIDKAKQEATNAHIQAFDELKSELADISIGIASKIIGKTLSAKDHEDIILQSLKSISK